MKYVTHKLWSAVCIAIFSVFAINSANLHAKDLNEKVKHGIDNVADHLKKAVDQIKGDAKAIQEYLDHYQWKGVIEERTTSGVATLKHLKLNGHRKAVVCSPGETVACKVKAFLDPDKCSKVSLYHVVIGLKGIGPQTTICNYPGLAAGRSIEEFKLTAPRDVGVYEVRFRVVESLTESGALDSWVDVQGNEPDASTTIGAIIVK